MGRIAGLKIAVVCCCFLALAACSKKNQPDLEADGGGVATPGSEKDFAVNVGDRIYFIVDQSTLTPEATETLRRQLDRYEKNAAAAKQLISFGESKPKAELRPAELAAYTMVANVILNLDETVTKN